MSYTNVTIRDDEPLRLREALLRAELEFWQGRARDLQARLENIRNAVRDWGYVDLIDGDEILTLVAKPDPEEAP